MTGEVTKRRGRPPSGGREAILAATLELLRQRGIGRLTTREVAVVAGVSEASIYYHFNDRSGLLQAVFEEGIRPLQELGAEGGLSGPFRRELLLTLGEAIERFLDQALPILTAAQSDAELRDRLAAYMDEQDLGPHRGVLALGSYLADEQAAGRVRADVDPYAVGLMLVGTCFTRSSQRQMPTHRSELPALADIVDALVTLLRPTGE
ncbi:MAG: TetR/AcrR family transcriptional regulator [Solirubrobacterales bacterium]|nr:TetR/AcrR family transcriptional regulator [Solirubrobacterales bacterium]MBV9799958.1 TetR/AcrR family transcriptional regulator [Solirubrobacterales bacterium]